MDQPDVWNISDTSRLVIKKYIWMKVIGSIGWRLWDIIPLLFMFDIQMEVSMGVSSIIVGCILIYIYIYLHIYIYIWDFGCGIGGISMFKHIYIT